MRNLIFLVFVFLAFVFSAKADPIPMSPELKAFLMQPEEQKAFGSMVGAQWRALIENCPSPPQLKQTNVIISKEPAFDQNGTPTSGQWRIVGRLEGCDQTRLLNILYLFAEDGQMKRVAMLPGTSAADPLLQHDALMYANLGMANLMPSKDCKDIQYTDTKFIGFGEVSPQAMPGRDNRSWTEEWTVRTCGVTGIVTMNFIPDATGTTITSEPAKTRQLSP
jgi:hypothetical protein